MKRQADDHMQHVQLHRGWPHSRGPHPVVQTADGWQQVIGPTTVDRVVTTKMIARPPVVKK